MEGVLEAEPWFACLSPLVSLMREEGGHQLRILALFPPASRATWLMPKKQWVERVAALARTRAEIEESMRY